MCELKAILFSVPTLYLEATRYWIICWQVEDSCVWNGKRKEMLFESWGLLKYWLIWVALYA